MKSKKEILDIVNHSHSSEYHHRFSSIPGYPMATDGIIKLAKASECFWLLDVIGSYQTDNKLDPEFQVWTLEVNRVDDTAIIRGYNNSELIITQDIPYTDFPLDKVKLYVIAGVILLPSEY